MCFAHLSFCLFKSENDEIAVVGRVDAAGELFCHFLDRIVFVKREYMRKVDVLCLATLKIGADLIRTEVRHFTNEGIDRLVEHDLRNVCLCKLVRQVAAEENALAVLGDQNRVGLVTLLQVLGGEVGNLDVFVRIALFYVG